LPGGGIEGACADAENEVCSRPLPAQNELFRESGGPRAAVLSRPRSGGVGWPRPGSKRRPGPALVPAVRPGPLLTPTQIRLVRPSAVCCSPVLSLCPPRGAAPQTIAPPPACVPPRPPLFAVLFRHQVGSCKGNSRRFGPRARRVGAGRQEPRRIGSHIFFVYVWQHGLSTNKSAPLRGRETLRKENGEDASAAGKIGPSLRRGRSQRLPSRPAGSGSPLFLSCRPLEPPKKKPPQWGVGRPGGARGGPRGRARFAVWEAQEKLKYAAE